MGAGDVTVSNTTNRGLKGCMFNGTSALMTGTFTMPKGSFSLSTWVYPKGNIGGNGPLMIFGNFYGLLSQGAGNSTDFKMTIRFGGATKTFQKNGSIDRFKWTHLSVTYDHLTDTVTLYKNGVDQAPLNTADAIVGLTKDDQVFYSLGARTDPLYYHGMIKDACFYEKALSQAQITQLANHNHVTEGLIHRYNFKNNNFNDSLGSANGTNTDGVITILDEEIATAVAAQRTDATDQWLCYKGAGGQVGTINIEN